MGPLAQFHWRYKCLPEKRTDQGLLKICSQKEILHNQWSTQANDHNRAERVQALQWVSEGVYKAWASVQTRSLPKLDSERPVYDVCLPAYQVEHCSWLQIWNQRDSWWSLHAATQVKQYGSQEVMASYLDKGKQTSYIRWEEGWRVWVLRVSTYRIPMSSPLSPELQEANWLAWSQPQMEEVQRQGNCHKVHDCKQRCLHSRKQSDCP